MRRQALHPFRELPVPASFERFERAGVTIIVHPLPMGQLVEPIDDGPVDVEAAVEAARAEMRDRGHRQLIWWLAPEHAHLAQELEALGLVNEDTPGFEEVENAMILTRPPAGDPVEDVTVELVETFEQFAAGNRLSSEVFGLTPEMVEQYERGLPKRYEEYSRPDDPSRAFTALIDGRVVGTAAAFVGDAGVNLFGGSVIEDARGRGVYRALVRARWDLATERGTPALTMQAGRMSKPIAERLGFELVGQARLYVDAF